MNFSKSCTSMMYCGTASGNILPPYVIYKATVHGLRMGLEEHDIVRLDGHSYWFQSIVLPFIRKLPAEDKKVLIGDNFSSHLSESYPLV